MDKIVHYINAHSNELNATIIYSTLDKYLDIVHGGQEVERTERSKITLPVVEGTFMGNNDDCCQKATNIKKVHSCWTGYYSSFPALKYALRKLDTSLRHAEILAVLATARASAAADPFAVARAGQRGGGGVSETVGEAWEAALGWGRHTQGIMQHHDAITGTGGGACDAEYHNMIRNATFLTDQVIANATAALTGEADGAPLTVYSVPAIPPLTLTDVSDGGESCDPLHIKAFIDCHPKGGEAGCHKMGCCWNPSPNHPYCFKPNPWPEDEVALPDQNAIDLTDPQWPADDGSVLTVPASAGGGITLIASNPLAWNRTTTLSFRIDSTGSALSLTDSATGKVVMAQLAPPEPWNASITGHGSHVPRHESWARWAKKTTSNDGGGATVMSRLIVKATLPALGTAKFFLKATAAASDANVVVSMVEVGDGKAGFTLSGTKIKVTVSGKGLLDSAQRVGSSAPPLALKQDLMIYWGNGGRNGPACNADGSGGDGGSQSDAYVFSPQGAASSLARLGPAEDRGILR